MTPTTQPTMDEVILKWEGHANQKRKIMTEWEQITSALLLAKNQSLIYRVKELEERTNELTYDRIRLTDKIIDKDLRISELEAELTKKQKCIDETAQILVNSLKIK